VGSSGSSCAGMAVDFLTVLEQTEEYAYAGVIDSSFLGSSFFGSSFFGVAFPICFIIFWNGDSISRKNVPSSPAGFLTLPDILAPSHTPVKE
jgi:hypothetical protein